MVVASGRLRLNGGATIQGNVDVDGGGVDIDRSVLVEGKARFKFNRGLPEAEFRYLGEERGHW